MTKITVNNYDREDLGEHISNQSPSGLYQCTTDEDQFILVTRDRKLIVILIPIHIHVADWPTSNLRYKKFTGSITLTN